MSDFISYIFDYLFSFLSNDICVWIMGTVALISVIFVIQFIIRGRLW